MDKLIYLDFEFRKTAEPELDIVSVALRITSSDSTDFRGSFWLKDPYERSTFIKFFRPYLDTHTLVAYAFTAEARCLFDLFPDLRPNQLRAFDLYLNYRLLLNHNDELQYGLQLIDGKEKVTKKPKPKYERTEEDDLNDSSKPQYSLAAAAFKMLRVKVDTDHKTEMRNIIIHGSDDDLEKNKADIIAYGESDIAYLYELYKAQFLYFKDRLGLTWTETFRTWLNMSEYAARTAWMERLGYPVNVAELNRFTDKISEILNAAAETVNAECPDVAPFHFDKRKKLYVKKEAPIRAWVAANHKLETWKLTDKGKPSLSLDAFKRFYDSRSEGFGGSIIRYLKTKQSLNGFTPTKTKRGSFYDYLGSDGRARPYFGIYGSQSSRSQPSATGFLPLKAHWMRYFIDPVEGRAITGVDYASQEFLIAALLSDDTEMVKAYASGDVYLAFGKAAKLIPVDGTKSSHKKERDICKTLVLGISYDMSAKGLSARLTQVTKEIWTDEMAAKLIGTFYDVYSSYKLWKDETIFDYEKYHELELKDGWRMLGDNDNRRSVGNYPVQGAGAAIMRRVVGLAQDANLDVILTLHDAIYCEHDALIVDSGLSAHMKVAFMEYFDNAPGSEHIRLDSFTWGRGLENERYVDDKGFDDLQRYRKFFEQ